MLCVSRHTFHNCCRQRCDAMGVGECKAAARMGHRSPLHHCPATAPRSHSVLASLQPDRPCPGEVSLVPVLVSCHFLSSFFVIVSCHFLSSSFVIVSCHFLSLPPVVECATSMCCSCVMHSCIERGAASELPKTCSPPVSSAVCDLSSLAAFLYALACGEG